MATSQQQRRRLVGVSFKMYFDLAKSQSYLDDVLATVPDVLPRLNRTTDVFLIPDFLHILPYAQRLAQANRSINTSASPPAAGATATPILLGAQDAHHEDAGAFTGEVSTRSLAQAGVSLLEMGHAERRRLFGETDEWVAQKAVAASRNGIVPLICIGEQSQGGGVEAAADECWEQVRRVFDAVAADADVVLAYEPVWAIGKPKPASADHVVAVTKLLRAKAESLSHRTGQVRILYGGSAGPGLFQELKEGVDGLFLGRFAHDPKAFLRTIIEVGDGLRDEAK